MLRSSSTTLDYRYRFPPRTKTLASTWMVRRRPFADRQANRMLRAGIQGYSVPADERQDVALTLSSTSPAPWTWRTGSGWQAGSYLLVNELRPTDSVAIVVYGDAARTVLDMTPVSEKQVILNAINQVYAEGSTQRGGRAVAGLSTHARALQPRGDQPGHPSL